MSHMFESASAIKRQRLPADNNIDFSALLPLVARHLLGDPVLHKQNKVSFQRFGSILVNPTTGKFRDYETETGGDVLAFIIANTGCVDDYGAVDWLVREGFLSDGYPSSVEAERHATEEPKDPDADIAKTAVDRIDGSFLEPPVPVKSYTVVPQVDVDLVAPQATDVQAGLIARTLANLVAVATEPHAAGDGVALEHLQQAEDVSGDTKAHDNAPDVLRAPEQDGAPAEGSNAPVTGDPATDGFLAQIERDAQAVEAEIESRAVPDTPEKRIRAEFQEIQAPQSPRPDRQARKAKAEPAARIPLAHSLATEVGWVSVPRALFSSKFGFREEPYTEREAWLWLLHNAAWQPERRVIEGIVLDLQRGQGAASIRYMAKAWGWEQTRVFRLLKRLERSKTPTQIATATATGFTVVTICHYEAIQNTDTMTTTPTATLSATNPQRTRNKRENKKTRQEGNKSESINHVTSEIPIKTQNRGEDGPTQPSVLPASDLNFYQFWERYPHKTGKPKARKSFDGIRAKRLVTQADLMAGLNRYIADKPIDRSWLNPATFLNQQRWADEPAPVVAAEPRPLPGAVVPFKPRPPARVALDVPALSEGEWLKHLTAFNHRNEWDRSILGPTPLERGCGAPRKLIIAAGLQPPEPLVNFGNGVVKPLGEAAARPPAIPPDRLEDTP